MKHHWLWEPLRAYYARKRLERMQFEAAAGVFRESAAPVRVEEEPDAAEWSAGNRKDWEFCVRTWRDGECFLRLFRQAEWPPKVHFIDPESIGPDPQTGFPTGGIETPADNVEEPLAYSVVARETVLN